MSAGSGFGLESDSFEVESDKPGHIDNGRLIELLASKGYKFDDRANKPKSYFTKKRKKRRKK